MRVGEAIVALLHDHYGVDVVFGIPGVHNIELYRGLSTSGVRAISPRHEQGAGFMADGYAIATGRPGVCTLITGPGLTNALTPMGQAYHDSRPMLVLAATTPTADLGKGHGPLHDISDQAAIARPVTAFSETVLQPDDVPALLARAFDLFHHDRPRPVHLAIPTDVLSMDTAGFEPIVTVHQPPTVDAAAISRASAALAAAHRPMIVAGGGAVEAAAEVRLLAERLGATVVLTGNAKGVVPSSHPLCAGNTLSNSTTQRLLAEADCVLVVGTELSDADIWNGGIPLPLAVGGTIVRIDIDPAQLTCRMDPTISIVGDAATALTALAAALDGHTQAADGAAAATQIRDAVFAAVDPEKLPWLQAIEATLPEDVFVALDSTQLAYTAHSYLPCEHPRRWLAPYGFGTLGCAIPMAIGAHIACPDRPAFALVGDGGWMFTIAEMATAVDVDADIVVVLWDNGGYGQIAVSFDDAQAPPMGVAISSPDPEGIARGFGWSTANVDEPRELRAAITAAFAAGGPQFIHVRRPRLAP